MYEGNFNNKIKNQQDYEKFMCEEKYYNLDNELFYQEVVENQYDENLIRKDFDI